MGISVLLISQFFFSKSQYDLLFSSSELLHNCVYKCFLDIFYSMEVKVVLQIKRSLLLKKYFNILIVGASSFHISSCLAT